MMCIAISMWDNNLSRILAFIASGSQVLWYFGKTCKYYVFAVLFDLRIKSFPDDSAQPLGHGRQSKFVALAVQKCWAVFY